MIERRPSGLIGHPSLESTLDAVTPREVLRQVVSTALYLALAEKTAALNRQQKTRRKTALEKWCRGAWLDDVDRLLHQAAVTCTSYRDDGPLFCRYILAELRNRAIIAKRPRGRPLRKTRVVAPKVHAAGRPRTIEQAEELRWLLRIYGAKLGHFANKHVARLSLDLDPLTRWGVGRNVVPPQNDLLAAQSALKKYASSDDLFEFLDRHIPHAAILRDPFIMDRNPSGTLSALRKRLQRMRRTHQALLLEKLLPPARR